MNESSSDSVQACLCCEKHGHRTVDCPQLLKEATAISRRDILYKRQICFRCISHRHSNVDKCTKSIFCKNCGKSGHLALLCFKEAKTSTSSFSKNA